MRPELVIFDCDGVIVDSEAPMLSMLHADLSALGAEIPYEDFHMAALGSTVPGIVARFRTEGLPLAHDWAEEFYERLYVRLAEHTPLIDGIEAVFDALDRAGVAYAVGSNGRGRKMEITLGQHAGLWARLQGRIYSGQDLGLTKPAPDLYRHIAGLCGTPPTQVSIIEDSPTGAIAARRAGMRCFGYAAEGEGARLAAEGATVFGDMAELPALLDL